MNSDGLDVDVELFAGTPLELQILFYVVLAITLSSLLSLTVLVVASSRYRRRRKRPMCCC